MSDVEEEFEEQTEDQSDAEAAEAPDPNEAGEDEEIEDLADDEDLDDEETRNEMKVVDEVLSQKEQNARSLAIRREIERRAEEKQFHDDVDYLDD